MMATLYQVGLRRPSLEETRRRWSALVHESNEALRDRALQLAFRAQSGEPLHRFVEEAYALVAAAAERAIGLRPYDVQIEGAFQLSRRRIIEMETGQGKSLTAIFPLFLYALQGEGAHLATTNDYLAQRDAEIMRPLFHILGMSVGAITSDMDDERRRQSYGCDITYGPATEFGFDFLRDRLKRRAGEEAGDAVRCVMRDLFFVVVDEADAVLVDEANMPMIIGAPGEISQRKEKVYRWATRIAPKLEENVHYRYSIRTKQVELNREGRRFVRDLAMGAGLENVSALEQYSRVETAIAAVRDFQSDRQYIVRDGQVVLVNEATGRLGEGRQWQDGIHQAIQSQEGLEITAPHTHAAKITIQSLFLSYRHLAGMTGTAVAAANEFRKVYKLPVVRIPTRHESRRRKLSTRYFPSEAAKLTAMCREIRELRAQGRPILVGTRSVEKSLRLSEQLSAIGIQHQVLNARESAAEAEIIARAGTPGNVVVATGMAGRGTDIKLTDEARQAGGLHVILTELHDSPRMDNQLFGRCARQSDPGTHRQYLSPDDDIMELGFGVQRAAALRSGSRASAAMLYQAQKTLEQRKKRLRIAALHHDKKKMRSVWEMGRDPLLDTVS